MRNIFLAIFLLSLVTMGAQTPINDTIACVKAYIETFRNDLDEKIF